MTLNYNNIKNVSTSSADAYQVDINKYFCLAKNSVLFHGMNGGVYFYRGIGRGTVSTNGIFYYSTSTAINTTSSYMGGRTFPLHGHKPYLHGDVTYCQFGSSMATGTEKLMIMTKNGYVLGAGDNAEGWLAQGNTTDQIIQLVEIYDPTDYSNDKAIKARLSTGTGEHASDCTVYILTAGGKLWAAGDGNHGKLGQGSTTDSNTLVQTQDTSGAVSNFIDFETSFGDDTTAVIAVKSDNSLWSLGDGGTDILGNGNTSDYTTFTSISELPTKKVKKIRINSTIAECTAYILYDDGALWACGHNNRGQLGNGNTTDVNTYFETDTSVDDIYMLNPEGDGTTTNTGLITRKGTTYYAVGYANYNILLNNASNNTTGLTAFTQMGTALPSGFAIHTIFENITMPAHNGQHGFIRIYNSTTGEYRILAPMYNIDGNMGDNTQTTISNPGTIDDIDITEHLPCRVNDVEYMTYVGGYSCGSISWLLDKFGNVYACGSADSYNGTSAVDSLNSFPFDYGTRGTESEFWTRVTFNGSKERWA